MSKRIALLSLLFLAMVASGCLDGGGSYQGSLSINSVEVSPSEIYGGQTVQLWLEAENTGAKTARISLGEDGEQVLKDYCSDIFKLEEGSFSAVSSKTTETRESGTYVLDNGQTIRMNWRLKQDGRVPLYGHKCELSLEVPFNYSVNAYRQIQVKEDRGVEGASKLDYQSSSGPLKLAIDAVPGETGEKYTFVEGEDENITVLLQMINKKPQGEYSKGLVDIEEESLEIEAEDPLILDERLKSNGEWTSESYSGSRCNDLGGEIGLYEGKSKIIRCSVPMSQIDNPGQISEISANVNYTYVKDVGGRTIKVKRRG